jgi:hypothetical protein
MRLACQDIEEGDELERSEVKQSYMTFCVVCLNMAE